MRPVLSSWTNDAGQEFWYGFTDDSWLSSSSNILLNRFALYWDTVCTCTWPIQHAQQKMPEQPILTSELWISSTRRNDPFQAHLYLYLYISLIRFATSVASHLSRWSMMYNWTLQAPSRTTFFDPTDSSFAHRKRQATVRNRPPSETDHRQRQTTCYS